MSRSSSVSQQSDDPAPDLAVEWADGRAGSSPRSSPASSDPLPPQPALAAGPGQPGHPGQQGLPTGAERAFLVFPRFTSLKPSVGRSATQARDAARLLGGAAAGSPHGRANAAQALDRLLEQVAMTSAPFHAAEDLTFNSAADSEPPVGPALPWAADPAQPGRKPSPGLADSTAELRELAESAGAVVVGWLEQQRAKPDAATLLGSGKVQELAGAAAAAGASIILVDYDLSPTQLRNLEDALPCPIIDRTQLILDIFARHARTREGQLQVELAQLDYMLPRLTGRGSSMSQTGGGIGTRGPGETKLETDRRRIGRRLVILRRELERVRRVRHQQRSRRESAPVPTVALVGYTNAGKSTLFNLLTGAGVLASSRMFATLDPKLRAITLPSRRTVVLSDTVGFIRNLPHTLVTSFRATLEEVEKADLLLHIRDAADPESEEHRAEVEKVLGELGVLDKPRLEVLNKLDLLGEPERLSLLLPDGDRVGVSALTGRGIDRLLELVDTALLAALVDDPVETRTFLVPQSAGDVLSALEQGGTVVARDFVGQYVRLTVRGARSLLGRWRAYAVADDPIQANPAIETDKSQT